MIETNRLKIYAASQEEMETGYGIAAESQGHGYATEAGVVCSPLALRMNSMSSSRMRQGKQYGIK